MLATLLAHSATCDKRVSTVCPPVCGYLSGPCHLSCGGVWSCGTHRAKWYDATGQAVGKLVFALASANTKVTVWSGCAIVVGL